MTYRMRTVVVAVAVLFCAASAPGQNVLGGLTNWTSTLTTPPPDPGGGGSSGAVTEVFQASFYGGAAPGNGLNLLSYQGRATETFFGETTGFRLRRTQEQTFVLGESALVNIPVFLNGAITFSGPPFGPPPSNFAFGEATADVHIYDATGAAVLSVHRTVSSIASAGDLLVDGFFFAETATPLAADTYQLRVTIEIAGAGGSISSLPGASALVDFHDGGGNDRRGVAVSLGAYKQGLGNSRETVKAPGARGDFTVDGTGVVVGLLEGRSPKSTHESLPAARLSFLPGDLGANYIGEHSLATSGIIAAANADTGNAGIAPAASIVSAATTSYSGGFDSALAALLAAPGLNIINRSAGFDPAGLPNVRATKVDATINARPRLTWVAASGNEEPSADLSVSADSMAYNIITVGALNRDFTARNRTSSFSHGELPIKPDIVAPGQYINAPVGQDLPDDTHPDGDGRINDFHRTFLGDVYYGPGGPITGGISGTSFAAPHVSGAAALLYDYRSRHTATHDADAVDHRVIKAVLLNGASTGGILHFDGATPWTQGFGSGPVGTLVVTQSLDPELGAGLLDAHKALEIYAGGEIRKADDNSALDFNISASGHLLFADNFWDYENSVAGGRVNYLLGDISGLHLRATLTWDSVANEAAATDLLDRLELRLYREGADALNLPGFDPLAPAADSLLAETNRVGENVKLFDLFMPGGAGSYYLQVMNLSGNDAMYGLAVTVPEPGCLMLLAPALLLLRRHRKADSAAIS